MGNVGAAQPDSSRNTPAKELATGNSSQHPGAPAGAAQASSPRSGPVGFRPPEGLLDANAKRRYLAAKGIELCVHLRVRDTPDHFVERSEEHTSELQSLRHLVCRLL